MHALPTPVRDDLADYASYITHRRRDKTRSLLTGATLRISMAYDKYVSAKGNAGTLMAMTASPPLKRALIANYALLESGRPMAFVRGELMASAPQGLCPMCGRGRVATLDHFLPKYQYPEFAAYAKNLVPACYDCNNLKGNKCGMTPGSQFLHAY